MGGARGRKLTKGDGTLKSKVAICPPLLSIILFGISNGRFCPCSIMIG